MAYYRLYFMNARSGHIERFTSLEAEEDCEAIRLADAYQSDLPMELWCGGRKVCRFEPPLAVPPVPSRVG